MADAPVFYPTPVVQVAQCPATANTAPNGTGTWTEVFRGDAVKKRKLDRVNCKMLATNTASSVRFAYSSDGGTTKIVINKELAAPVTTVAAGTPSWEGIAYFEGLLFGASTNNRLYAAPYTAHEVNVVAEGFEE